MTVYSLPEKQAGEELEPNVVISRDRMDDNETFKTYVDRQIGYMTADIPQFDLLNDRFGNIKNVSARDVRCRWMTPGGRVQQRLIFLSPGRGEVVTFAATAADDFFESHADIFNAVLGSLSIEEVN